MIVEHSSSLSEIYARFLEGHDFQCLIVEGEEKARSILDTGEEAVHIVLLDLKPYDPVGIEFLKHLQKNFHDLPALVITGQGTVNFAMESMRYGAREFLVKPFSPDKLIDAIQHVFDRDITFVDDDEIEEEASAVREFHGFIGSSPSMNHVYDTIERASCSDATIFITGDSGTGKELCAEAIHACSDRKDRNFVTLNCAAIPENLIESEIFGHVKGAFTGAVSNRDGAAVRADGGTLFLDEICEMPLVLQAKLLRFIQTLRFQAVGDDNEKQVDVRIICATNKNPAKEVVAGKFREDLFYRLHVVPIVMPPLRERGQDVIAIAESFLRQFSEQEHKKFVGFSVEAERELMNYQWPGNIRQLQNIVRNIVVLQDGVSVTEDMLPYDMMACEEQVFKLSHNMASNFNMPQADGIVRPLWQIEKNYIEKAIDICEGNVAQAAQLLDVSPSTLYRKVAIWKDENAVRSA